MRHVIAIDQGTTGTTVLILDEELRLRGRGYREFPQIYPQPGWVEHDPEAIWASVTGALGQALAAAKLAPADIAAIGITNQRETSVLWDRATGHPVHNAIVWQDRRTADACAAIKARGVEARVRELTGLPVDPYFSGTKIRWILDQDPALAARAGRGELAFATIDGFLIHRLTGGQAHAVDVTNASRTLLCELRTMTWSDELCGLLGVPRELLPTVVPSSGTIGVTRGVPGLPDGVPICGVAGDQQAALFGQACFEPGDAKCTFGTGAFILMNTGTEPVPSHAGLVTTVAWKLGDGEVAYALEGSAFIAGAAVQWLRDGLGLIGSAAEIEALARSVPDAGGVVVVPAFTGLGAPHWRPEARGLISGLTRGTTRAHLARATLEGIALQNVDILRAMERDSGRSLRALKVDGGAAANDLLMQYQADVLGVAISRPEVVETTALGAAYLAGLAAGVWTDKDAIRKSWREERRFEPAAERGWVDEHLARWATAVGKA
ncbi:MAG: glycerol kinase GlpK [Kofleriaceae bacterium]|nr:glycerol kinase GlpK [Myxococcales bacterium]MCB9561361.1 glycerol kinase GlpK [Kofleriaceae bacterium]MCB9574213.1 glycerol kinase GlpK [Kofleriaceae bacterium]